MRVPPPTVAGLSRMAIAAVGHKWIANILTGTVQATKRRAIINRALRIVCALYQCRFSRCSESLALLVSLAIHAEALVQDAVLLGYPDNGRSDRPRRAPGWPGRMPTSAIRPPEGLRNPHEQVPPAFQVHIGFTIRSKFRR